MFGNQFDISGKMVGENTNPVLLYAVETCLQLTLAELNENLRKIYVEAYTVPENIELIHKKTAVQLQKIFAPYLPDYHIYMTDGFREKHGYNEKGEIETFRISEHTGILMLFEFPESVTLEINEERSYAIIWKYLMKLQKQLPRALMYYGRRDENGVEKNTSKLVIFLPFCHFEHEMEKTVELANGIGLGCREAILAEIKALKNDPKNKTAGV